MLYYVSKLGWFFATPSNLLPSLVVLGLALMLRPRRRRLGWTLAAGAVALIFVAGLSPLSNGVIAPLEGRFPPFRDDGRPVTGVIVLGGAVDEDTSTARGQIAVNEAAERVIALADLARRYPEARVVFSGGTTRIVGTGPTEAEAFLAQAAAFGLDPARVTLETRSRTTGENARFSRALLDPKPGERWLLVTSAWHMPRAVASFRKAGFRVTAYPVDFRTAGTQDGLRGFAFAADGLRRLDLATKEWIGLLGYRLAGETGELWPGPEAEMADRG